MLSVLFLSVLTGSGLAAKAASDSPAGTPIRKTLNRAVALSDYGNNQIYILNQAGDIVWQVPAERPQDVWVLPNGNILFSHLRGATEVTRAKKVVWTYRVPKTSEVHACQPLPNGVVMIAESGPMQILEVDRQGQVIRTVKLQSNETNSHRQMRSVRKLPSGHYLVGQYFDGVVREYGADGRIIKAWQHSDAFSGIPIPDGRLLCACGDAHRVIEYDASGKVVWEVTENDLKDNPLRFVAGLLRLPNGNTLICNWGGHGYVGQQPQVVEITPDKKVVGELYDFTHMGTITSVYLMEEHRDPTQFEVTR
jgi:outer membrane protein assembly factor BamB